VLSIPQATSFAPHQNTLDHKYYRRSELRSIPMCDYEIRDILRRATTPELWIDFNFNTGKTTTINFASSSGVSDPIKLVPTIGNKSQQPASYAVIYLFFDGLFTVSSAAGLDMSVTVRKIFEHDLKIFTLNWGTLSKMPIFNGVQFVVTDTPFMFKLDSSALQNSEFYIGYQILTAGFSTCKYSRIIQHPKNTLQICPEIDA
jgi:hypothetical protein